MMVVSGDGDAADDGVGEGHSDNANYQPWNYPVLLLPAKRLTGEAPQQQS